MNTDAIRLENLTKSYHDKRAVDGLNLSIAAGEIFGFLGPNGAGKTTTIRLMLGFLRSTTGRVLLLGSDMTRPTEAVAAKRRIGFLPDVSRYDGGVRGADFLDLLGKLQGREPVRKAQILEKLSFARADLRKPFRDLSKGMRQKLAIAQALQHAPDLLILDEPTEGLDPLSQRAFLDLLSDARRDDGTTVFFSSHILVDVERLCDRVGLIRAGRLVAVDEIAALRARAVRRVEVTFRDPQPSSDWWRETGVVAQHDGLRWRLDVVGDLNSVLAVLAAYPVADLSITPAPLEDIFLDYYQQ